MTNQTMELRRYTTVTVDRQAVELTALFAVVLGLTTVLAINVTPETATAVSPPDQFGEGTQGQATAGVAWALMEVVFACGLLGSLFVFNRLPDWLQTVAKRNFIIALLLALGASQAMSAAPLTTAGIILGAYTLYKVTDHYGLYWLINDALVIPFAVLGGLFLALLFGVVGLGLAMVALTIYDHAFADKRTWMFQLGGLILKARLPVLFIRPEEYRFQWMELAEAMGQDGDADDGLDESNRAWGLGTADLMLPAGFVAAVAINPGQALAGIGTIVLAATVLGVLLACFRLRFKMLSHGSGAGLPALCTGALVPYAVAYAAVTVV